MFTKTYIKHEKGIPKRPIIWTHKTIYVDIQTGEEITKHKSKTEYIIQNYDEHITLHGEYKNATRGHIERTNKCRKKPQLQLFETT